MGKKQKNKGGLVYSTDPDVGNSFFDQLDLGPSTNKKDQVIRVWLEKKHRGGKEVAVIKGLEESEARLKEIAKIIKSNNPRVTQMRGFFVVLCRPHKFMAAFDPPIVVDHT